MTVLTTKERDALAALADRLNAIDTDDFEVAAPQIVEAFKGFPSGLWLVLDNRIGNASERSLKRPHLVRMVRNTPVWGKKLFAALDPYK